ncbi:MarR family winged helix-turn-helix transcriptional regulator [Desulfitobacterium hafniense]|uniref:HTH marR-type domain-containing protein n=2 Tax=Desulfitobacterium hafniense TaxID=49338 RepID=Q24XK0_DESHY|nr:MarR family transcriptional regulator [Desulfitobacterium hafniense]KTE91363.1 hypothetical protein AT727_22755 [Desulfitobacterium hafniense]BAE83242.1 hypothetical protein DSY1453 [Desulfitobacterium hafniense Y51]
MVKHLGKYISTIHRYGQTFFNPLLEKYNLNGSQRYYIFLLNLYDNNGIIQEELSKKVRLDKVTTTRALQKLEQEGYIYRIVSEEDRRAQRIYTTPKAEEIREELENIFSNWNEVMLGNLSENQRKQLFKLMEQILSNVTDYFEEQEKNLAANR